MIVQLSGVHRITEEVKDHVFSIPAFYRLLPKNPYVFFKYNGSLTKPPFAPVVQYVVFHVGPT